MATLNKHILVLDIESNEHCPTFYVHFTRRKSIEVSHVLNDAKFLKFVKDSGQTEADALRLIMKKSGTILGFYLGKTIKGNSTIVSYLDIVSSVHLYNALKDNTNNNFKKFRIRIFESMPDPNVQMTITDKVKDGVPTSDVQMVTCLNSQPLCTLAKVNPDGDERPYEKKISIKNKLFVIMGKMPQ
ncbi:MAG: hypothetical protein Barrevirus12_15 [Barrevirus sp.]|uniref:Uncharacterized protein n=1 Tax=Barrevirus sp. TaxID=2487763 RepID=A0A3G4ZQD4_9VIRU|nr:MAG: hypothetical protein Barrevirus12_15 [Barrevirus sp.]